MGLSEAAVALSSPVALAIVLVGEVELGCDLVVNSDAIAIPIGLLGNKIGNILASAGLYDVSSGWALPWNNRWHLSVNLGLGEATVTFGSSITLAEIWISEVEVLANLSIDSEAVTIPVPLLGNRVSHIPTCARFFICGGRWASPRDDRRHLISNLGIS